MNDSFTYQKAGVDPEKAASILKGFSDYQKSRPKDPNILSGIGPFASAYRLKPLLRDYEEPILVTCCDGVGTKLKLALQWDGIGNLGQDLVAMNVNDLICLGAKPLLFLDYYACGKLDDVQLSVLLKSIQDACEKSECSLVGGETAEMPGLYQHNDFDLAGFAVGVAEESQVLGAPLVETGDVILGLPSSGFHSNGYSLVRTLVEKENIQPNDKPSFSKETWKEILLKPTTLYPKMVLPHYSKIHALVHVTGGGLHENLPRVLPEGLSAEIDSTQWHIPPLFHWAQKAANLSTEKLLSTFNCGYGLLVVTSEAHAEFLMTQWNQAKLLGKIISSNGSSSQVIWK